MDNQGRSDNSKNQNKEPILGERVHDIIFHCNQVSGEMSKSNILKFPINIIQSIIQIFEQLFPKTNWRSHNLRI